MKKPSRKTVGLALGAGGARGLAHIGIIKVLLENNIPIDYIAGSSAGALVGGLYAALEDIKPIENLATGLHYKDLAQLFFDPIFKGGIVKSDKIGKFLSSLVDDVSIESLKIPFTAVATDAMFGTPVLLMKGKLASAIRASSCIPLIFSPMKIDEQLLIDGGASIPVPVSVVRKMGADIVIGVNLEAHYFPEKQESIAPLKLSTPRIAWNTLNMLRFHLAKEHVRYADVIVEPNVPYLTFDKFVHGQVIIEEGIRVMSLQIPRIKELLL